MSDQEKQDISDSLFPVNGERWIKIHIIDQEKTTKLLWMPMNDEMAKPYAEQAGFRTIAIGMRDEYTPQVSALMDLKGEIISKLYGLIPEYILEDVNNRFRDKIEELKKHTIKTL